MREAALVSKTWAVGQMYEKLLNQSSMFPEKRSENLFK